MPGAAVLDLNDVIDGQKLGSRAILFLVVAMLALISDGYALSMTGYMVPLLQEQWHVPLTKFVPAQTAPVVGMFIGAPLLGFLGDRFGRKRVIVVGLFAFGLSILAGMAATSVAMLAVQLFLTGLTLGGVIPNVIALVAELTPQRIRGRLLVLVSMGIVLGIAIPGLVTATLAPAHGWRVILLVGGLLALAIALASALLVPESIKYLMQRGGREAEVSAIARWLRPDLRITSDMRFSVASAGSAAARGTPKQLFAGDLAVVTPLLWLCQATNQVANFFSLTSLPSLLKSAGATTSQIGATAALFPIGGLIGGVLLLSLIDALGVAPLVLMFFIGAPLVAAIALADPSFAVRGLIIFSAGLCVTGIQLGLTALLGIFYPTPIRSMGTGWTQAAGRLGAIAAPLGAGLLQALHIPLGKLPLVAAAVLLLGGGACTALAVICRRRFGGFHPGEFAIAEASVHPVMGSSAELIA